MKRSEILLTVFQCGPRRDVGGHEVAAHVDKPRKEEAAGVLDQSMGKECIRLGPRLQLAGGWKDYGSILHLDSGAWSADLSTLEDAQRILGHRSA